MLIVLNIVGLIIIHINLNDQINKRVICVVSCYPITNWVIVFEFVNFDTIIICVIFELVNTVEYLYIDTTLGHELSPLYVIFGRKFYIFN